MNDLVFMKLIEEYMDLYNIDFKTIETSVGDTQIWFSCN